jgi:hypothetical protein
MKAVAILGLAVMLAACPPVADRRADAATRTAASLPAKPAPGILRIKSARGGCSGFMKDFPPAASPYRVTFERPLTISRGFGESEAGVDVHILATNAAVDGTLKCRGEDFLRFELRIAVPPKDKASADFDTFSRAALISIFHWDQAKAETVVHAMGSDAAEYLQASEQRGDLYVSGKVEYHQADNIDIGVIWTQTDRTFVAASQSDQ